MGFLDFFGGGTPAVKASKLKSKATQKYGDPTTRQKALQQLADLSHADAVPILLQRFTFAVEPQTTDAEEKQNVFDAICKLQVDAVEPVKAFLTRSDAASSWALRILEAVLSPDEVMQVVTVELQRLGTEYTRDPEKKEVLLRYLEGKRDARVGPVVALFLRDMSDDVKMAALKTLAGLAYPEARVDVLHLLCAEDTARRVQTACVHTLVDCGFDVHGFREQVEKRLPDGFAVDKAGLIKKRG
jgi:hypothetical protein